METEVACGSDASVSLQQDEIGCTGDLLHLSQIEDQLESEFLNVRDEQQKIISLVKDQLESELLNVQDRQQKIIDLVQAQHKAQHKEKVFQIEELKMKLCKLQNEVIELEDSNAKLENSHAMSKKEIEKLTLDLSTEKLLLQRRKNC